MSMEAPRESIEAMYVSESFLDDEGKGARIQGYPYEVVSDSIFRTISDTQTPQGILCLVRMPEYHLEDLLGNCQPETGGAGRKNTHLLVLENIQDPGNLGTMIRAGEGAGVTGILMDRTTVDIFNPKTIRATMGALYRVPFYITPDLPETLRDLKQRGVTLYGAHLEGAVSYEEPDYRGHTGFLIGNEGNGLSPEIAELADIRIRIPMEGRTESLNAAVAAALLMYEVSRQRK